MKVLSLFDGISACRLALTRSGINVDTYYTSEIDKYATQISKHHYPDAIRLGDVTKWEEWNIDWASIDIVTGGSPCQGFSFAGKQLAFDDPRSKLFFVLEDIFKHVLKHNPKAYFLLENVRMKKEFQDIITKRIGVEPIKINSSLVSSQNRVRLYWTNIQGVTQPEDKGLVLKDIIESDVESVLSDKELALMYRSESKKAYVPRIKRAKSMNEKSNTLTCSIAKGVPHGVIERPCEPREFNQDSLCHHAATATDIKGNESVKRVYAETGKAPTLTTMGGGHREPKVLIPLDKVINDNRVKGITENDRGLRPHKGDDKKSGLSEYGRILKQEAKTDTLTTNHSPKVLVGRMVGRKINPETGKRDDYNPNLVTEQRIEPRLDEKCGTLTTVQKDNLLVNTSNLLYRKLTPLECERLQTFDDHWTYVEKENGKQLVSNSQRYKAIGNAWTVDVIAHIFSFIKK